MLNILSWINIVKYLSYHEHHEGRDIEYNLIDKMSETLHKIRQEQLGSQSQ